MPQYKYAVYNPGQYPADVQKQWDELAADGWHVHTALPNYSEIAILWEKDGPGSARGRRRPAKSEDDVGDSA